MGFWRNRWFKFALWGGLYLLWVIWLGNYWWLLGLPVIFDLYVTKKVKWAFWRRKEKKGNFTDTLLDWLDAGIFAVVAAMVIKIFWFEAFTIPSPSMEKTLFTGDYLFVSKVAYGPKIPQTPLSVPLVHNSIFGGESYSTLIQNKYRRLKGFGKVKRYDIVVFSFPNGDTVLKQVPQADYYQMVRLNGGDREAIVAAYGPMIVRPKDKKDNYVKRCVAIPGDTLQVIDGAVYVNRKKEPQRNTIQSSYTVITKGDPINKITLDDMRINPEDSQFDPSLPGYPDISLTAEEAEKFSRFPAVLKIEENIDVYPPDYPDSPLMLFPFDTLRRWTRDNYGPIWIPQAGATVTLDGKNISLYRRIITSYEDNSLEEKDGKFFINGEETTTYTFRQDYYWMMGDNRHNSLDSRYWGFVPEDHIVGTPYLVWFSRDRYRSFPQSIRWNRIFKFVRNI
ncbi:MAG: S26 family signal peptidase [Bacteroidales bacterium]|nr:S26 family signal peptidase [Bacteroidales bacterium]